MTEKDWKEWITKSITASELLNLGACWVGHICLTASAGGAATALVYNSQDASGELKLALSAITSAHFDDDFVVPIFFDKGLYVTIGNNVTLFVIQYKLTEGK